MAPIFLWFIAATSIAGLVLVVAQANQVAPKPAREGRICAGLGFIYSALFVVVVVGLVTNFGDLDVGSRLLSGVTASLLSANAVLNLGLARRIRQAQ